MSKFTGFALMELVRATGDHLDIRTARTYDVMVYDKFGKIHQMNLKLGDIEREWGHFRRKGDRFGMMEGSDVRVISAEEFQSRLAEWMIVSQKKVA